MKNNFLHIFVNVFDRSHDKYLGIKKQLCKEDNHHFKDVNLSQKSMNQFREVEFGIRKYFREFYYHSVFKEFELKLIQSIDSSKYTTIVYLQDEGVWSEFLKHLIKKYNLKHIYFVNVQHGFLTKNPHRPLREKIINFINSIYKTLLGFPKFGIGPFKGPFHYYLLFHEELLSEVPESSNAIYCPNLINRAFIDNYYKETVSTKIRHKSVLIALQHNVLFGNFSQSFKETMKSLVPLIESLKNNLGFDIFLRKHPGMDKNYFIKVLRDTGLYNKIIIDKDSLEVSLKRSPYILSFYSTILFEATLIGRVPVIINNYSFSLNGLPVSYDIIDLKNNLENKLKKIFKKVRNSKESKDEINWVKLIEKDLTIT